MKITKTRLKQLINEEMGKMRKSRADYTKQMRQDASVSAGNTDPMELGRIDILRKRLERLAAQSGINLNTGTLDSRLDLIDKELAAIEKKLGLTPMTGDDDKKPPAPQK